MSFQPEVNGRLTIDDDVYKIGEHPNAPGVPYGQEGRQGTVYLLYSEDKKTKKAMKVFRSKFVNPTVVFSTQQIAKFRGMTGLLACERFVVTPQNSNALLKKEPELLYSVIMPWIEGPTWMDVILDKICLKRKQSHMAAVALAGILAALEQRGLAHCDLSAPNVMLPMLKDDIRDVKISDHVQLVDLEQMYSAQFDRPEYIPVGSPGYAGRSKTEANLWSAYSDRFAGAVILMEMLAACTDSFMNNAWGESYFAPTELQTNCERYEQLIQAVRPIWGEAIVSLFISAWESEEFNHCPTFGEWLIELSKIKQSTFDETVVIPIIAQSKISSDSKREEAENGILLNKAKDYELKGNFQKAIEIYRSIHMQNPHTSLAKEVDIAIDILERKLSSKNLKAAVSTKRLFDPKKIMKMIWISLIIIVIGVGGYLSYPSLKSFVSHLTNKKTEQASKITNAQIESLNKALKEKDATIVQLTKQLKEQKKPPNQKRDEFINQLNNDYQEIKRISNMDPSGNADLEKKTLDATVVYLNHFFDFVKMSFNLDKQFDEQTSIVEGYYFPYMYNDNRNAQLNLQFFKDYKGKF